MIYIDIYCIDIYCIYIDIYYIYIEIYCKIHQNKVLLGIFIFHFIYFKYEKKIKKDYSKIKIRDYVMKEF